MLILGARQVGKTTLARQTFPAFSYLDLEDTGAVSATVIDQGQASDPLAPGVTRRGFAASIDWLPGG